MPIYEYYCENCDKTFEVILRPKDLEQYPLLEECHLCMNCRASSKRILSTFAFNQIGILTGVDDTDELTLGKLVQNRGIPAEFKPTIKEIQERERKKQLNREYRGRVKKYQLDKPSRAEKEADGKPGDIIVVDR